MTPSATITGESNDAFERRLLQAKLDAMKELAYGASHEINNPLANISARAQTLLREEADPERRRALEAIHHQALRAHEMISDLMLFARPPRLARQSVDVASLVRRVAAELADDCRRREIELVVDAPLTPLEISADSVHLAVAIKALCVNALEAIGRCGRVEVIVSVSCASTPTERDAPSGLSVEVRDNGPGIAAEIRPHIFDPFYSGREAGRGLGFGLSKCWRIVTEHGGTVEVDSAPGEGALFTIQLPATRD